MPNDRGPIPELKTKNRKLSIVNRRPRFLFVSLTSQLATDNGQPLWL